MFRVLVQPTVRRLAATALAVASIGAGIGADASRLAAQRAPAARAAGAAARDSAVVAVERSIWEHIAHGRWDGATSVLGGAPTVDADGVYTWSTANTDRLRAMGCALSAYDMREVRTREVAPDVVALGYRALLSMQCGSATPSMSNLYLSVYRRRGAGWELVATSITRAAPAAAAPGASRQE
jgi:hypothetical protein